MTYDAQIRASAEWLGSVQNDDGGFGVVPNQPSTIVNSSEAAFVLKRAGLIVKYRDAMRFIRRNWEDHIDRKAPRLRYVAFALFAFADSQYIELEKEVKKCIKWLEENQNTTGSWSARCDLHNDCLFSTFLANWSLKKADYSGEALRKSHQWLLSQGTNSGWSMTADNEPSHMATAYAILSLSGNPNAKDRLEAAKSYLLQSTPIREHEESVVAGTTWKHATHAWLIPALLELKEPPYAPAVAATVRRINRMQYPKGGWTEGEHQSGRTVRAQFWATYALEAARSAFDPKIHTLRIDAERAEAIHEEPEFVKFKVRSPWAVVIPSKIYKGTVYFIIAIVVFLLSGFHESIFIPSWIDQGIIVLGILATYFLVDIRKPLFPKVGVLVKGTLILLTVINLVFGITLLDFLKCVQTLWNSFNL